MAPDRSKAGGNRNRPEILTDPRAIQRVHLDHHQIASRQTVVKTIKDTPITDLFDVQVDKTSPDFTAGQSLVWGGDKWIAGDPEILIPVRNPTDFTISKGKPVYVESEHNSGKPNINLANSRLDRNPSIGLLFEDIPSGGEGHVVGGGVLSGLDTSSFVAGDALYLSSSDGILVNTRPTDTLDKVQKVALVIRSHHSAGSVIVMGAGRTNDVPNGVLNDSVRLEHVTNTGSVTSVTLQHGSQALGEDKVGIPLDRACKTNRAVVTWRADTAPAGTWTLTLKKKAAGSRSYTTAATITVNVNNG